ncbi:hypothetical protein AB0A81_32625 [Streptomyces flaveolus]|uniref:Uncharacterized protein n=1 Tax=Streptomyces flaveolus TaxID=67297 RepID=A0ABV1VU35_9ACTN
MTSASTTPDTWRSRIMHRVMLAGEVPVGVDGTASTPLTGSEPGRR